MVNMNSRLGVILISGWDIGSGTHKLMLKAIGRYLV